LTSENHHDKLIEQKDDKGVSARNVLTSKNVRDMSGGKTLHQLFLFFPYSFLPHLARNYFLAQRKKKQRREQKSNPKPWPPLPSLSSPFSKIEKEKKGNKEAKERRSKERKGKSQKTQSQWFSTLVPFLVYTFALCVFSLEGKEKQMTNRGKRVTNFLSIPYSFFLPTLR